MLVENAEIVNNVRRMGTLKLTGYVRGAPFNVNKLIHIQGIFIRLTGHVQN